MPQTGINSVTVPGAVAGWSKLSARFGRLPLGDVLSPAIQIAETGFPVPEITAAEWQGGEPLLRATRKLLGSICRAAMCRRSGKCSRTLIWQRPIERSPLADVRRSIAEMSHAASSTALRTHGGVLTAEDLAAYDAEWVTPLSTTYRGWTVYELPPNGQGIAALMMLNLMEHSPIGSYGHNSAEALHALIEAKKLAYADMAK